MQRPNQYYIGDHNDRVDQEYFGKDLFCGPAQLILKAVSICFFQLAILQQDRSHGDNHDGGCNHRKCTCRTDGGKTGYEVCLNKNEQTEDQ